jgi:hypothetical protein
LLSMAARRPIHDDRHLAVIRPDEAGWSKRPLTPAEVV